MSRDGLRNRIWNVRNGDLRRLLNENGIEPGEWPIERTERALAESHRVRREIPPVRLDTLYARDPLFDVWRRFFEDVLEVGDGEV